MDILYENMTIAHDAMKKSDILVMYFLTMSYVPTIETNHLNKSYYSFYFHSYATIYQRSMTRNHSHKM